MALHETAEPDGRFAIVVNRCELRFAMPGQGGDAPGYVRLVEWELPVQWDMPPLPQSLACEGNESSVR